MSNLRKRRRQVTWKCFKPYLKEQQLIAAIELLERYFQFDSTNNLIAFISKVCKDFEIDAPTRKSLYVQFHGLMSEDIDGLFDPLELSDKNPFFIPVEEVSENRDTQIISNSQELAESTGTTPELSFPDPVYPAHVSVFAELMRNLLAHIPEQEAFFAGLKNFIQDGNSDLKTEFVSVYSWFVQPHDFQWAIEFSETKLAELVHLVYTVLCELLGPVKADESFHKALAICEQTQQAKEFRPSRFF